MNIEEKYDDLIRDAVENGIRDISLLLTQYFLERVNSVPRFDIESFELMGGPEGVMMIRPEGGWVK